MRAWMEADFRDDFKRMFSWIKARKLPILVVIGWGLSVALLTIKSYLLVYIREPLMFETGMIYTTVSKWVPRLDEVDYLLIFIIALISGAILADFQKVLFGWIVSTSLSFIIPIIFSSFFIWFSLGTGEIFTAALGLPGAIEAVSVVAFRNIFRMMFPFVSIISLITVFVGAFLRGIIQPSAGA